MLPPVKLPSTISISLEDLAKMIDHSLLHPTMIDAQVAAGLAIAAKYKVATACTSPIPSHRPSPPSKGQESLSAP
ncbi:MAG: hypothetical protein M1829_001100 [Trizodia sp. TS-e1964]|nr:MAG: hypothetical protein M1829_001100 [Trizodia sp. TS-e1964]